MIYVFLSYQFSHYFFAYLFHCHIYLYSPNTTTTLKHVHYIFSLPRNKSIAFI